MVAQALPSIEFDQVWTLIGSLHRNLLVILSARAGKKFQGLQQAAKPFRRTIGNSLHKRIAALDLVWGVVSHITAELSEELLRDVRKALDMVSSESVGSFNADAVVAPSKASYAVAKNSCHTDVSGASTGSPSSEVGNTSDVVDMRTENK